jgi:hypothetical protein
VPCGERDELFLVVLVRLVDVADPRDELPVVLLETEGYVGPRAMSISAVVIRQEAMTMKRTMI